MEENVVNRMQIELEAPLLELALSAQDWFAAHAEATLAEAIDRCPRSGDWDRHVIDHLEIDLGRIELSDMGGALVDVFAAALQDELSSITFERYGSRTEDVPLPTPSRVLYFLKHGTLPWWSRPVSLDALTAELVALAHEKPAVIQAWFDRESAMTVALAVQRSSLQLGDASTQLLLAMIAPRSVELGTDIVEHLPSSFDRAELWAAIASVVGSTSNGVFRLEASEPNTWLSRVLEVLEPTHRAAVKEAWESCDHKQSGFEHGKQTKSHPTRRQAGQSSTERGSDDKTSLEANADNTKWSDDDFQTRGKPRESGADSARVADPTTPEADLAPPGQRDPDRPPQQGRIDYDQKGSAESPTEDSISEAEVGGSNVESRRHSPGAVVDVHKDSAIDPVALSTDAPRRDRRSDGYDEPQPSISNVANVPLQWSFALDNELSDIRTKTFSEPALAVDNAGIVLLWPFLGELFRELGYRDVYGWSSDHRQHRAIHVLQWMATGEYDCAPEHMLSLNKVLTGLALEAPVSSGIVLDARERHEADDLLRAVIQHWSMLKSTSINGLRGSFLMRPGLLEPFEGRIRLRVEGAAFDVLLEHLPWGLELVQLSWMREPLEVQWWTT